IGEGEGFDHIHGLVEATKRAFGVRDRVITDPDDLPHPVDRYLDAKFLDAEALTIDRRKAARWPVPAPPARAAPSGWAPPTPRASWSLTCSRSTGNSAPGWCCPRPAC